MTCRLAHQPTHSCLDIYGNDVSANPAKCAAGRRAEYRDLLIVKSPDLTVTVPADFILAWRNGQ